MSEATTAIHVGDSEIEAYNIEPLPAKLILCPDGTPVLSPTSTYIYHP